MSEQRDSGKMVMMAILLIAFGVLTVNVYLSFHVQKQKDTIEALDEDLRNARHR